MHNNILLVGCGDMAVAYAKVLSDLRAPFDVIGRGEVSCASFASRTGVVPLAGGVERAAADGHVAHDAAIIAAPIDQLAAITRQLIAAGVRRILVEKPAGLNPAEIAESARLAAEHHAAVFIAYNRRFYASTRKAREMLAADGGVTSFYFEFTEWAHEIRKLPLPPAVKKEWFLANSSHVCDLAFFLGGLPKVLTAHVQGSLDWHPSGAQFAGCGVSRTGALFSYHSNWESAGRWGVELCTAKRRLYLRPLETLQEQLRGELALKPVTFDDRLDKEFKPGLHAQTRAFLQHPEGDDGLLALDDHARIVSRFYRQVAPGYVPSAHD